MLPHYVKEIATTHYGLRVLWLRLSELRPDNRESDVLRALEGILRPLARDGTLRVFHLPNDDYILAFHRDNLDVIRALLVRLRFLVPDDPLATHFGDPPDQNSLLLHWWRLEDDFDALTALSDSLNDEAMKRAEAIAAQSGSGFAAKVEGAAEAAAEAHERAVDSRLAPGGSPAAESGDPAPRSAVLGADFKVLAPPARPSAGAKAPPTAADDEPHWRPIGATGPAATSARSAEQTRRRALRPIDLDILDRLQNGLARADLSNHVRRQPVCALIGDAPPQPIFSEIYISIPDLRDNIAPSVDLTANRWLFQHFTETLDQRVLSWLNQEGNRLVRSGFSININIGTILSEHFLRFEKMLAAGIHGTVVLEVRAEDVFADLEAFAFARDFVHQRGYRLCLDFMTPDLLALLDRERMGIDLIKVFWHPALPAWLSRGVGERTASRLRTGESGRTILARCDDPAAIDLGRSMGLSMFQGRRIDALLDAVGGPVTPEKWS
jgi:hypothetical protein